MNKFSTRRSDHRFALAALALAVALFGAHSPLLAKQLPQLLMIIDASSSMEDQVAGELKYKIIRRAMSKALPAYGGKFDTGLVTFGATNKKSCKDIKQLVALKTLKPKLFSRAINKLAPTGRSPIGASLAAAANIGKIISNPMHMLLIADGGDNCGTNICTVAKNIAEGSPQTKVHVIGIGHMGTVKKLACVAKATNGSFAIVSSSGEMTTALNNLFQTVTVSQIVARQKLATTMLAKLVLPPMPPLPPLPTRRPPHKLAKYQTPNPLAGAMANVKPKINPVAPLTTASTPEKPDEKQKIAAASPAYMQGTKEAATGFPAIPKGSTPIQIIEQPAIVAASPQAPATPFIEPKPRMKATLPQSMATVKLGALISEQGKEIENGLIWRIYNTKKDDKGHYKLVKSLKARRFEGNLPLGVYLVNLSWGRSHLTEKMDILSSKPFARNFVLNAGGLRLGAKHMDGSVLPSRNLVYRIYSDERDQFGKRRLILANAKPGKTIRLNAGIYHVTSLYGTANGLIGSDITVEAGKLTDAVINHTASKVTFKLVNQPGGEALAGAIWRISSPDGKIIKEAGGALPTIVLAAGDYTINAQYSGRTFARKVTIEPGAPVHVEIVIQ